MKRYLVALLCPLLYAASMLSSDYGPNRTSSNPHESILMPATVPGLIQTGSYPVDSAVFSQPLVIEGVKIGGAYRNVLLVCTMADSCYGFDADNPKAAPFWRATVGSPALGYPGGATVFYGYPNGCVATPVIDPQQWLAYVVCGTSAPGWVLAQISLSNGQIIASTPISGQVPGTGMAGDTIINGQLQFNPYYALARGLALANSNVYVTFSSHDDFSTGSFHGWVFSYSTSLLTQNGIFCTTPNGSGGSIWQSNAAPAIDSDGNLYVLTGNGTYDGVSNWANSLLKFSPSLQLLDWFTPSNYAAISASDLDLSSGHPMLIPGSGLVTFAFKDANIYSMPMTCLGHLAGSTQCPLQIFPTNVGYAGSEGGVYSGLAYQNGTGYFAPVRGPIYEFPLSSNQWTASPSRIGSATYNFPGATMTVSSNDGAGTILWVVYPSSDSETAASQGTLAALNPSTLTAYWSSTTGGFSQLVPPTVLNGRVYVPTIDGTVRVYGLPTNPQIQLRFGSVRGNGTLR